jgi:ABC-type sugar transport system ATPase subunit
VFQSFALYPHLAARENIAVPLAMRRLSALERMPLLRRVLQGARAKRANLFAPEGMELPWLPAIRAETCPGQRMQAAT